MNLVKVEDLFEVKYGVNLELTDLNECSEDDKNSVCFVSRTDKHNGISAYVQKIDNIESNPANTISVACGGSVLATFFQQRPFYSGRDIYVLKPKKIFNEIEMVFYCFCIRKNKYRYNYGRQANKTLKDILIPEKILTEWINLETEKLKPKENKTINSNSELKKMNWQWFNTTNIFEEISIAKSTDLNTLESSEEGVPYIGRSRENNGITAFIKDDLSNYNYLNKKNCLTVVMVGDSTCYTFWQKKDFIASQNILILRSEMMNNFNALFLSNIIFYEKYRFSYGRTLSKAFFETIKIKLPSTRDEKPDWQFMEDYIKSLPYSSSL